MNARLLVLAASLALAAVACGASPAPVAQAPVAPAPPKPPPAEPASVPAPACPRVWTGHEAIPPEFLACKTTDDCTTASSGSCCPGPVAVNNAHAACMQAQELPCKVICPPRMPMAVQCVRNTCTMVPAK